MPRLPARLVTAGALAALAVGGVSACSVLDRKTFEDNAELTQKISSIRLDTANGDVEVDAAAGISTASVHRTVDYRGDRPAGTSFTVEDGVLTLSGCGRNCGVDYVVKVPAGIPVTGGTSNGQVTLTGVGTVDVHTGNGRIAVDRTTGPVKLRTSNGDVDVEDATGGDIDTQTSNGGVRIRTVTPQNVTARTTSGDLDVTAPPADYRVSADDVHGDKRVAFANNPSGRYRLDLSTTNGDLTVESAGQAS